MTCDQCIGQLMDVVDGAAPHAADVREHLAGCESCRLALVEVREGFAAFSELPRLAPPAEAVTKVRTAIVSDLRGAARARPQWVPAEITMAAAFGMAAALASTLILSTRVNLSGHSPLAIAAGAILWTGAFIAAFWLILRKGAEAKSTRDLALCGVGAMTVFMVVDYLLPLTHLVHFCEVDSWGKRVFGPVGVKGMFFIFGSAYAMVPIFLFALATGGKYEPGRARSALLSGGLFFFLLAPAVFLQCRAFTTGAVAAWLFGAVLGSLAGSAAGYWVKQRASA